MPRLIAAMAAGNTASAAPLPTCASITGQKLGQTTITMDAAATAADASAISARLAVKASTSAPAGAYARTVAMPPTVRASPAAPGCQ
jgi:hypothetical protein